MLRDLVVLILFIAIIAGVIVNYFQDAKLGTNLIVIGMFGICLLSVANHV